MVEMFCAHTTYTSNGLFGYFGVPRFLTGFQKDGGHTYMILHAYAPAMMIKQKIILRLKGLSLVLFQEFVYNSRSRIDTNTHQRAYKLFSSFPLIFFLLLLLFCWPSILKTPLSQRKKAKLPPYLQSVGHKSLPMTLPEAPEFQAVFPAKCAIIHCEKSISRLRPYY